MPDSSFGNSSRPGSGSNGGSRGATGGRSSRVTGAPRGGATGASRSVGRGGASAEGYRGRSSDGRTDRPNGDRDDRPTRSRDDRPSGNRGGSSGTRATGGARSDGQSGVTRGARGARGATRRGEKWEGRGTGERVGQRPAGARDDARGSSSRSPEARDGRGASRDGGRGYGRDSGNSTSRGSSYRDGGRGRSEDRGGYRGQDDDRSEAPVRKGWGSVARRGAAAMREGAGEGSESDYESMRNQGAPERNREEWIEEKKTPSPRNPNKRSKAETSPGYKLPEDAIKELAEHAGDKRVERLSKYLKEAARAYAAERWGDARKSLRPVLAEAPEAPAVQELNGMIYYRMGKWAAAIKELQTVHTNTMEYDLHPVIMDCHRALKQYQKVDSVWEDLREASPDAEVMAEGRMIQANSLAEQGRLQEGIRLLEKTAKPRSKVQSYHVRTWYVLGDLYDRAGETGKARSHFERVAQHEPELGDVLHRIAGLD